MKESRSKYNFLYKQYAKRNMRVRGQNCTTDVLHQIKHSVQKSDRWRWILNISIIPFTIRPYLLEIFITLHYMVGISKNGRRFAIPVPVVGLRWLPSLATGVYLKQLRIAAVFLRYPASTEYYSSYPNGWLSEFESLRLNVKRSVKRPFYFSVRPRGQETFFPQIND